MLLVMRLLLLLSIASLASCASEMKAVADCSYKAGTKYAGRDIGIWKEDPEGKCSFHLEAPIKKAEDASRFADSFNRMILVTPKPQGVGIQPMEVRDPQ